MHDNICDHSVSANDLSFLTQVHPLNIVQSSKASQLSSLGTFRSAQKYVNVSLCGMHFSFNSEKGSWTCLLLPRLLELILNNLLSNYTLTIRTQRSGHDAQKIPAHLHLQNLFFPLCVDLQSSSVEVSKSLLLAHPIFAIQQLCHVTILTASHRISFLRSQEVDEVLRTCLSTPKVPHPSSNLYPCHPALRNGKYFGKISICCAYCVLFTYLKQSLGNAGAVALLRAPVVLGIWVDLWFNFAIIKV